MPFGPRTNARALNHHLLFAQVGFSDILHELHIPQTRLFRGCGRFADYRKCILKRIDDELRMIDQSGWLSRDRDPPPVVNGPIIRFSEPSEGDTGAI